MHSEDFLSTLPPADKVGVFWSSGLESTLLLLLCIEKYGKDNVFAFTQKLPVDDPFATGVNHYSYHAQQLADEIGFPNIRIIETPSHGVFINRLKEETYRVAAEMMPELDVLFIGINKVFYGRLANEYHLQAILDKIAELPKAATPFLNMTKAEIIELYHQYGYEEWIPLTRSCGKNTANHCGTCTNCMERRRAFKESGYPDPTQYNS